MSDGPNDYTHSDEMNAARLAKAHQLEKDIADAKKQLEDLLVQLESVKREINQLKKKSVKFADKLTDQPSIDKNTAGTRKNKKHSRKHKKKRGKKTRRHISKRYKR